MTTAFESGKNDGIDRVEEDRRSEGNTPDVSRWFGAGMETADIYQYAGGELRPFTALINACDNKTLAEELGVSLDSATSRDDQFWAACAEYNLGFEAGAKEAAQD